MEAMRLSLLEHEAQQRREEDRARREGLTDQATSGGPSVTPDGSAPSRTQSGAAASSVAAYSPLHGPRVDGPSTGTSADSRSSTPVSGQTTSSSPPGTAVDDPNDISHSTERSIAQLPLMTDTPAHISNDEALTAHAERARSLHSTTIRGQGQQSEDFAGPIMTSCIPFSSSLSDTDASEHP